ncbi:MAG: hypothetical protein U0K24_13020 [Lachnospiraceae bacterium]|nr:hypothetical protein [Lachnospiraceae bacterium]
MNKVMELRSLLLGSFLFERNFDSGGVEVENSVKSGDGVAFSMMIWYNIFS